MSFIFPQIVSIASPSRKPERVEESSSDSDLSEDEFPLSDFIPARQAQQSAQKSSIESLIDRAIHTLDKTNTVSFCKILLLGFLESNRKLNNFTCSTVSSTYPSDSPDSKFQC